MVIGTYGDEQEESVKTIDSGVKTTVFHALPKYRSSSDFRVRGANGR
jgi:hypothetical protein